MSCGKSSETSPSILSAPKRGSFDLLRFGGEAALVVGAGAFSNLLSYAYHFLVSRRLGPDAYGTLVALMSVANMLAVLGGSLGTVAMQECARMWAAHADAQVASFVRRGGRTVTLIALGVAFGLGIASLALGPYVHVTDWRLWALLAINVGVAIAMAFARGAAQGGHRFGLFAASLAGEGLVKVLAGYGLVIIGYGVAGAIGGLVASAAVASLMVILPMTTPRADAMGEPAQTGSLDHVRLGGSALRVLGITASSTALLFIDMLFAKHHFSGLQAGYFGAAGTLARTLPFGISLMALYFMPKAAAAAYAGRSALARLLGLVAISCVCAIGAGGAILVLFGTKIMTLTYGAAFAPAAPLLRLYTLDEALLALWLGATSYLVALARYRIFPFLLLALVVETICYAAFASTPARLLSIAIATNAILVPIAWWLAIGSLRGAAQATVPHGDEMNPSPSS